MKKNNCKNNYHISIEFWGGESITRYTDYMQTLRLFKKDISYGHDKLVVCSSSWYEMEFTIKNKESAYFVMRPNGELFNIGIPEKNDNIDESYGEECVILKISNFENLN